MLTQPIGARQISLGEASAASADDLNSLFYNPAGLVNINKEFSMTYLKGLSDTYYNFFGYAQKYRNLGYFGVSLYMFRAGSIEIPIDAYNTQIIDIQNDYLVTLSYAKPLIENCLSYGLNLKYIQSTLIETYTAKAFMGDFGLLYKIPSIKNLSLGFAIQNLGTKMTYQSIDEPLPLTYRFGAAYKLPGKLSGLKIESDLIQIIDSPAQIGLGIEYNASRNLSLRMGYKKSEDISYYSLGLGFALKGTRFDYGQNFNGQFDSLNQMTLTFKEEAKSINLVSKSEVKKAEAALKDIDRDIRENIVAQTPYVEKELADQIEKDLIPIFGLMKEGKYFESKTQLNILLSKEREIKSWQKLSVKLNTINEITSGITKPDKISAIVRKGLLSFLKPIEDPKDALIKLRYAWEKTGGEKDKELIRNLYGMLQKYYSDIAKLEAVPKGMTLIDYKLFKALNSIYDGHYDIAIQESQEVLDLEPDNVLALKRLGSAFYCVGIAETKPELVKKGRAIWKKVINISPDDKEIKEFLEKK